MFRFEPTWSLRSAIEASALISLVVTTSRVSSKEVQKQGEKSTSTAGADRQRVQAGLITCWNIEIDRDENSELD
jgi:hypothetical protein